MVVKWIVTHKLIGILISSLLFLWPAASGYLYGQDFRHLLPADGLDVSEINSIAQNQEGILWLGTETGLISFDGLDFNYYRPELGNTGSLPDRRIRALLVDSHNNLWVATNKKLSRYLKPTDSFLTYNSSERQEGVTDIMSLVQYRESLILHSKEGLYLIPFEKKNDPDHQPTRIGIFRSGKPASHQYSRIFSFDDKLYLVDNETKPGSALILQAVLETEGNYPRLNIQGLAELEDTHANFIEYSASRNMLFIATSNGLQLYSLYENKIVKSTHFSDRDIRILKYTSTHRLYMSGATPELLYVDLNTGKSGSYVHNPYLPGTLINNNILCLFEDFSGNLWAGHQGQGVSIKNLYRKEFEAFRPGPLFKNPLSSGNVTAIGGNNDFIFLGFSGGGITYMHKNSPSDEPAILREVKYKYNNKLIGFKHSVWDIKEASGSRFWVGSDIGLLEMHMEEGTWVLEKFSNEFLLNRPVRQVMTDDNYNIWCSVIDEGLLLIPNPATNTGKIYYRYHADTSDPESLSDNTITSMEVDSKGRFWLGTLNGLNLLETSFNNIIANESIRPQLKFKRFVANSKTVDFLNNNEINCIYENSDGNIWFATQGGGINILDPETGTFTHITAETGLPSNDVTGILSDELGNLWISTKKGLVVYRHAGDPLFLYFCREDGLHGDRFTPNSSHKSLDGELFFGGETGMTRFYPRHIRPNEIEPKIVFTRLNFGNETAGIGKIVLGRRILDLHINETERIVLPHNHKTFSIGAAAIHYQYPRGNRIRYRLLGYDEVWRSIPSYFRSIYYSNLPPGKYILEAKAVNSNNISSSESKLLFIQVLKPWYLMWYSMLIMAILGLGTIGLIIFIFFNRQKMLYERKIDKLRIENTESKMAMLSDIAHGIKTPLSLVIAPISELVRNSPDLKPEMEDQLLLVQRNARYLTKLTNQIIDFSKIPSGKMIPAKKPTDVVRLIRDVIRNFNSFEQSKSVKILTEIPFETFVFDIDPQQIEEVLYNIISNAFKHTPQNHKITISLDITGPASSHGPGNVSQAMITVFNEGEPIPEKHKEKIFERFYKVYEHTEGTGIGLSFSKSLVELHGGTITAMPVDGRGTAFQISLPCVNTREAVDLPVRETLNLNDCNIDVLSTQFAEIRDTELSGYQEEQKLKIVLVEDNTELRCFLKKVLSKNYKCYEACDGVKGLELINRIIPDIVISDVIMPGKDGYELCKNLKENTRTCHIPVILLTAKNSQENIISGFETGADAYISKPFDLDIITSQISRLIKNRELIRKKYQEHNFMVDVTPASSMDDEFLQNFTAILEKNLTDPDFNVSTMADYLNVSVTQLYRKIRALTGHSPVEFIKILKLNKSYILLRNRKDSVKEVCYMSGFNNISYFIKCFKTHFGITPAQLKNSGGYENEPAEHTGNEQSRK